MAIKALIFDLGSVLLAIDWEKYREDTGQEVPIQNLWPIDYEKMNTELLQFLVNMRPLYKIAILSNGGLREAMNRKFRLGELVDLMVFDGEEGVSKPDSRIYQLTLMRLAVQAEEAVFIDDKVRNVDAAQQLGIHSIHFKNTAQALAEIQTILSSDRGRFVTNL